jgi:ADP-ribose pyrophosphatase
LDEAKLVKNANMAGGARLVRYSRRARVHFILRLPGSNLPPKRWKTVDSREIYRNKWMRLREDIAEMPDGRTTIYGVCEFGRCVGVLPFAENDSVILVRQYRYVQQEDFRWEMPTGGIKPGETPSRQRSANWARKPGMSPGGWCR